uniref:hypothetical protein n=1 Tax=Nonomuraea bangladeshensis TaxID=404385 RepID=UPI003F499C90
MLTPGQYGDSPQLRQVPGTIRVPRLGPRRPRTRPDSLATDKPCSSHANRAYLRRRKIRHTIPEPRHHPANRRRRGSNGGRPTGFNAERHKAHTTSSNGRSTS